MNFDEWSAPVTFAGSDRTRSVVPTAVREVLERDGEPSQHQEVVGTPHSKLTTVRTGLPEKSAGIGFVVGASGQEGG